jgi:8-oxo-dGTP pyrophosphatase MutT (NUDIX family)
VTVPTEDTGLRCVECDYNLTGIRSTRCPECGWKIDLQLVNFAKDDAPPTCRYLLVAILAGLMAVASGSYVVVVTLRVFRRGTIFPSVEPAVMAICAAMALCTAMHIAVAMRAMSARRGGAFAGAGLRLGCRIAAVLQIASMLVVFLSGMPGVMSALGIFLFATAPGWTLLIEVAVPKPRKRGLISRFQYRIERGLGAKPNACPFTIDTMQSFREPNVRVERSTVTRGTDRTLDDVIESTWRTKTHEASRCERQLFNGSLGRLVSWDVNDGSLTLRIGDTDYKSFLGTNLFNPHLHGTYGDAFFANPLGTSAVIVTSDGWLIFGRRNDRVAFHAGYLHTIGGILESADRTDDGGNDVFGAMRREVREELLVTDDEIAGTTCIGMVRDRQIVQPELVFEVQLAITRAAVLARFDASTDAEHTSLESCFSDPSDVVPFIESAGRAAPVAVAAMLTWGRSNWGADWFESSCYALFGDVPEGVG